MGLTEFIEQISSEDDGDTFSFSSLSELSGISRDEVLKLAEIWNTWSDQRVLGLVSRLWGLAEDDALLEFENVFTEALNLNLPEARSVAVNGLTESSDPKVIGRISKLLSEDNSEIVRLAAAQALSGFAIMARDEKLRPIDMKRLRISLDHALARPNESPNVRRRVLETIGAFTVDEVILHINRAYTSGDELLVQSALIAMARSSDSRWLPEVTQELKNPSAAVRYEAAQALGRIGDETHADRLKQTINDTDSHVAIASCEALAALGGIAAKELLAVAMQSDRSTLSEAALDAIRFLVEEDAMSGDKEGMFGIFGDEFAEEPISDVFENSGNEFHPFKNLETDSPNWN